MSECSQIFAPCLDPDCTRPCGKRDRTEINADADKTVSKFSRDTQFAALAFTAFILITGAAYYGLSQAEQAYQSDRRV